jgi:single-strand DNA-binding protein
MSKVFIAGHLGGDPESRFTPSGQKVTSFSVAENVRDGKEKEDVTIWWRITVWGDRFDKMLSFLKKGSAVMVWGQMRPVRIYMNKENQPQASMEVTADSIEFSPFGRTDKDGQGQQQQRPMQQQAPQQRQSFGEQTFGMPATGTAKQQMMVEEEDPLPF